MKFTGQAKSWALPQPTPLRSTPIRSFVANLTAGLTQGFWVGYQGNHFHKTAKNLPLAHQHPLSVEGNLLEEVELGHLVSPFESFPFPNFLTHPLGLVLKKNSHKWCTIFHLSFPKGFPDCLNANIPLVLFTLHYICIDNMISLVLEHGPQVFHDKNRYSTRCTYSSVEH